MTKHDMDGDETGRDVALGDALRSLRPVLRAADVSRLTARIMADVAIPIGYARAAAQATWWAVTANWASVAVPAALAAGVLLAVTVSQLPQTANETAVVASSLGVINRDTAVANLESLATPSWLQDESGNALERAR